MNERIMIAIGSDELASLRAEVAALRDDLRGVKLIPRPDWVTLKEYADQVGKTTKTIHNWIKRGELETRRHGATVMVRVPK